MIGKRILVELTRVQLFVDGVYTSEGYGMETHFVKFAFLFQKVWLLLLQFIDGHQCVYKARILPHFNCLFFNAGIGFVLLSVAIHLFFFFQ